MKKFIVLSLILVIALSSCEAFTNATEAPPPAEPTVAPPTPVPPTAEVIVVTVEVPVQVTAAQPAASEPTTTQPPEPTPTIVSPTETSPSEAPPTEAAPAAASTTSDSPLMVDSSLWGGYFKDITYSNDSLSLRCQPKEVTIMATATDPYIVDVDLYFRIEDRQGTYITEWKNTGKMKPAGNGVFTKTISGEDVHPDLRKALAWFDIQLVGLNKQAAAVGRTGKIVQLITYTIDCQ